MFTDHQEAAMQVPVTASLGEVPATVLPTRFAQTSGVVLPPLTTPSTVRQMIFIPSEQLTVAGSNSAGLLTE